MTIHDVSIGALLGGPADLAQYRGKTMLIVNVASKCGLTPQYESLQRLYERINSDGEAVGVVACPACSNEFEVDLTEIEDGRLGE